MTKESLDLKPNIGEILNVLPKYVQALHSDALLFFSGETTLSTDARKAAIIRDIELIKEQITNLEKLVD